jgi:hypothetical protein
MNGPWVYPYVNCESSKFIREKIVVARKKHRCSECGREIHIGEKYEYAFGVWNCDSNVYKTCSDCLSIRFVFLCYGWCYGQIWELTYEMLGDGISSNSVSLSEFDDLTPLAREKVIAYIDAYLDNND